VTVIDLADPAFAFARDAISDWLASHEAAAVLVRPDHLRFRNRRSGAADRGVVKAARRGLSDSNLRGSNMNVSAPRRVLVVGATGFLGAKIVANLLREPGIAVRAMSRKGAPADAVQGAEWVRGDLTGTCLARPRTRRR
jgi:hypothetical protein